MTKATLLGVVALVFLLASPAAAESEAERAARLLGLAPGMTVADIGAGKGEFAFAFARSVGETGRVFATELEAEQRDALAERARDRGLANVEVIAAGIESTGLATGCCQAAFMRHVYHHLTEPEALSRDLLRALQPGALFVVLDFPPAWLLRPWTPDGVGEERSRHGIEPEAALRELEAAGFERVQVIPDFAPHWLWPDGYALVLRKPR